MSKATEKSTEIKYAFQDGGISNAYPLGLEQLTKAHGITKLTILCLGNSDGCIRVTLVCRGEVVVLESIPPNESKTFCVGSKKLLVTYQWSYRDHVRCCLVFDNDAAPC